MKNEHETCRQCGTDLKTDRQKARGVCGSCDRERVTK
jgi:hypothetical protein